MDLGEDPEKALEGLARSVEEHGDYIEAVAEARGQILRAGFYRNTPSGGVTSALFQKPARLAKIGIFPLPKSSSTGAGEGLGEEGPGSDGTAALAPLITEDIIYWHTASEDLYVFEGEADLGERVGAVLLTDSGERIYIPDSGERVKISRTSRGGGNAGKRGRRGKMSRRAGKRRRRRG